MMKGGGTGRFGGGGMGTREPPLIELVEKYLADNSNLSYINIDDMVDYFQAQYFRFARMQRKVFANQVRTAYFDYCRRNGGSNGKPRENNQNNNNNNNVQQQVRMPVTPTSRPVENTVAGGQSDSDIEEIGEENTMYSPRNDILNASLSSMYKSNAATTPAKVASMSPVQAALVALASSSSTPSSKVVDSSNSVSNPICDSDDDDLEIIEEVQGRNLIQKGDSQQQHQHANNEGMANVSAAAASSSAKIPSGLTMTVLPQQETNGSGVVSSQNRTNQLLKDALVRPNISGEREKGVVKIPADNNNRIINSSGGTASSSTGRNRNSVNNGNIASIVTTNSSTEQQRGIKRKNASSLQEDQSTSDQLSPKKLKKEISVVSETGYRLADFAGSEKVVEEVCRLLMHLKHPEVYKAIGVTAPRGFLLHGPPGVGKTLLANAIAGELQLPMLKVTGTEFVSGISGESESNIRDLFNQAATIAPCIIFIDEIDSITPKRENAQREMERRIVAQLLSCVDDLMNHEKGNQVLLIGATNRIEAIDTALRRAGRFDKEICLGIPDEKSRRKILEVICRNLRLAPGFDLSLLAKLTPGYVGADLQMLVREAAVQAVNKALMEASAARKRIANNKLEPSKITNVSVVVEEAEMIQLPDSDPVIVADPIIIPAVTMEDAPMTNDEANLQVNETTTKENENVEQQPANPVDGEIAEVIKVPADSSSEPVVVESSSSSMEEQQVLGGVIEKVVLSAESADLQCSDNNEEKMEVDSESVEDGGSFPQITAVTSNAAAVEGASVNVVDKDKEAGSDNVDAGGVAQLNHPGNDEVDCDMRDNAAKATEEQVSSELPPEDEELEAPYLRWIKETAPLTTEQLDELYLFIDDFEEALKHVQPSSKREGFATVPDTTWDDIGALADIREELEVSILGPVKYSHAYEALGLMSPAGVLLCGPPGCGKTLLAKAVAHEAGINFISVKGPELLNMYVGESERAVRQCFLRAKNSSPCVIFFDEIDALCPRRSDAPESGSGSRIVNQLLTEMDGVEGRQGVFIMAATNRPDILDPAILRPGRLDKILFVDLPSASDRYEILKTITKNGTKPALSADVDLKIIAEKECLDNYTGADLASLVREASIAAFKELVMDKSQNLANQQDLKVSMSHFETALFKTKPSVTKEDRDKYAKMKVRYSSIRGR